MAEAERTFFDVMKETINTMAPGLKNFGPEVGAELSRLGTLGSHEMAQALFNGSAFTPYGQGQYKETPELENGGQEQGVEGNEVKQHEQERGGRDM